MDLTLGTHVGAGETYESTLRAALPVALPFAWVGELRVKDAFENEVRGLYAARVDAPAFREGHAFLAPDALDAAIREGRATPHLAAARARLRAPNP